MMQNDYSKLKHASWLFSLCLVIDKLFHSHLTYKGRYIGSEIFNYAVNNKLMERKELNDLKDDLNIQNGEPDQVIPKILPMTLKYNGIPVEKEIQCLLIAWNLRNFAGHNIQTQNVLVNNFVDILKILLFDIFLIIEKY